MQKIIKSIQFIVNVSMGVESAFRVKFYSLFFPIGKNTIILSEFRVRNPEKIKIGKGTFINYNCYIQGSGGVTIGDDVLIGSNVSIYSENHIFQSVKKKLKSRDLREKRLL